MASAPKLRHVDLTQGPITRTLVMFSLPVLGTSVLQSLNGSVNAIWVGRLLGEQALTATANATLILIFMLGAVFGVGMAATILVGQAVGAKKPGEVKRIVGTAMTFFIILSAVTAIAGYTLSEPILRLMQTPPDVTPLAVTYLRVIFLSLPFMFVSALLIMIQRGAGDAKTPFRFSILAVGLDIAFNPLLILGVGPLPEMGIAGAAMSTLVSQAISMVVMVAYLYWRKSEIVLYRGEWHFLKPDPAIMKTLVLKGLPMGAQMLVVSVSAVVMMAMINSYGAQTAAAYAVAMQLWTYLQMPAMAIGMGVSSFAAQNVGAKRWDRVDATARSGVVVNVALTGALIVLLYIVDPYLVQLFLPGNPEAIALAERINTIGAWAYVGFGVMFVLFGVVRATGAVTPPLLIMAFSLFVVRISFAVLLQPFWGADAIWWSFAVSMMTSMLLSIAYYRWGGWRKSRMAPAHVEEAPDTGAGAPAIDAMAANAVAIDDEPQKV
jgi:putative MATE family efflux protein